MYGHKKWTIKMTECQRNDAFKLRCWKRLLRVPWTARSNQSFLNKINPEYSLEYWCWSWSSNTLVTWWEKPTHWKRFWCWEKLRAKAEGSNREWDDCMASLSQWTWLWAMQWDSEDREVCFAAVHGVIKSWIQLSNNKFSTESLKDFSWEVKRKL